MKGHFQECNLYMFHTFIIMTAFNLVICYTNTHLWLRSLSIDHRKMICMLNNKAIFHKIKKWPNGKAQMYLHKIKIYCQNVCTYALNFQTTGDRIKLYHYFFKFVIARIRFHKRKLNKIDILLTKKTTVKRNLSNKLLHHKWIY